jgi:hypothetical protein
MSHNFRDDGVQSPIHHVPVTEPRALEVYVFAPGECVLHPGNFDPCEGCVQNGERDWERMRNAW